MSELSTRQKVGLVLAGLLSIVNIPSVFFPAPGGGDDGPPIVILAIGTVLGVIGLVAVAVAWRSANGIAIRVAAGTVILNALLSMPAFFVDVPAGLRLGVGVSILVSLLAVVLMFSSSHTPAPRVDEVVR